MDLVEGVWVGATVDGIVALLVVGISVEVALLVVVGCLVVDAAVVVC